MLFNLLPIPPLDGHRIIEHRFCAEMRWKMRQPLVAMMCLGVLFLVMATLDAAWLPSWFMHDHAAASLGLPIDVMTESYNSVFLNVSPPGR